MEQALAKTGAGILATSVTTRADDILELDRMSKANNTVAMKSDDFEQSLKITKVNDVVTPLQESTRALADEDWISGRENTDDAQNNGKANNGAVAQPA